MQWASTVGIDGELDRIVGDAADTVVAQLGGTCPDLVIAFVSSHHQEQFERVPGLVRAAIGGGILIGCSAGGVIGGGTEIEDRPAVSLTAAVLPAVEISPFQLCGDALPGSVEDVAAWRSALAVEAAGDPLFLLFPDPFSFDSGLFLAGLDRAFPRSRKIGGVASGATRAGEIALYLGAGTYRSGLVGLALSGDIRLDTVVTQGCRPIGEPMFVTHCDGNRILGLDGQVPLLVLRDLYESLGERDRLAFRESLCVGVVVDHEQQRYRRGDFLVRDILGIEEDSGIVCVATELRENLVVQFHLRDRETSARDVDDLLGRYAGQTGSPPAGSLMFSCMGRGSSLYGEADHDTGAFRRHLGGVPLGGFFCGGEIGPLHGRTFVHGYTSSFGLFRDRSDAKEG